MALRPALRAPSYATLAVLESALASLRISQPFSPASKRYASHQAQGRANGAKQGPGKRLGGKKMAGEYVVTGNILFRQRGTHWYPGDNCFMGRDHTIHAATPGYVTYYKDPARHPDRKFIGVVFERGQTLPQPANAPRRRRLGMLAFQMPQSPPVAVQTAELVAEDTEDAADASDASAENGTTGGAVAATLNARSNYQFRPANWEIARAAEESEAARSVRPFRAGDRFAAWRRSQARKARNAKRRALTRGGKKRK